MHNPWWNLRGIVCPSWARHNGIPVHLKSSRTSNNTLQDCLQLFSLYSPLAFFFWMPAQAAEKSQRYPQSDPWLSTILGTPLMSRYRTCDILTRLIDL